MNIKQIRYFVSVFDHGSLSAAAKDQYVTVQAVSKAIADLERELKSDLFIRESRGVRPTMFGKSFYAKANSVLRMFDELEDFATHYKDPDMLTLQLALCSPPFRNHERACASLAAFATKNLGIRTTVQLESGPKALAGLRSGLYDAVFTVGAYEHPEVDCMNVGTVGPGVIMAPNHPLVATKAVTLAEMKQYRLASSNNFETFNDTIVPAYRKRGLNVECLDIDSTKLNDFLAEGGLTLVIGLPVLGEMHPHTVMRMIAPEDAVPVPICLVSPKAHKSPAYRTFERWLAKELMLLGKNSFGRFAAAATGVPSR